MKNNILLEYGNMAVSIDSVGWMTRSDLLIHLYTKFINNNIPLKLVWINQ